MKRKITFYFFALFSISVNAQIDYLGRAVAFSNSFGDSVWTATKTISICFTSLT